MQFHTILYPTDFSPGSASALRYACALARDCDARLVVVHALEPAVAMVGEAALVPSDLAELRDAAKKQLDALQPTDPSVRMERVFREGPAPAVAYGGSLQLLSLAPYRTAAPGVELGHWSPSLAGDSTAADPGGPSPLDQETVVVSSSPIPGLVDEVSPSVRQLIQALDGQVFMVRGEQRTVQTVRPVEGGVTTVDTVFASDPVGDRILHLATRPEAAFFFLVAGLTVATFELLEPSLAR